ncbi:MAG: hypothetical protein KC516_01680 [Nanoarchaeota archaeon]|nr:hypothetical protein [Nanoarchaeota archaeon]
MGKTKIIGLIDEYRKSARDIDNNFMDPERREVHEREEKFYKPRFAKLGVSASIISTIYASRNNEEGIEEIKENIEKYLN